MKLSNVLLLPIIFLVILLQCDDKNPSGPSGTSESLAITQLSLEGIAGKYTLQSFAIEYTTGQTLTSTTPGITFSGTMTISGLGDMVQNVTVNGNKVTSISTIKAIESDSVMVLSSMGMQYKVIVYYSGDLLKTTMDATQVGQNYTETDTWKRISRSLNKEFKAARAGKGAMACLGVARTIE